MAKRAIWDTNVFRYIGAGNLSLVDVQALLPGADVLVSPASVLELASKYTEESFNHRKAAAQAIIDLGARMLPDPELNLTRDVFKFTPNDPEFDWTQAVVVMAQAPDMTALQTGVSDFLARVRRSVDLDFARQYRDSIDRYFIVDMLLIQNCEIPRFSQWWNPDPQRRFGPAPRIEGAERALLQQRFLDPAFFVPLLEACRSRALFKTDDKLPWPPTPDWVKVLVDAWSMLDFCFHIYRRYL